MKSFLLKSVIIAICAFVSCKAYVFILPNATNPDYPGECFDPESEIHLLINTTKYNNKCERLDCRDDFTLTFSGCGIIAPPEGCHLSPVDYSKQYPDCCPKPICNAPKNCELSYNNGNGPRYPQNG